jgi:hypothetical protein
MLEPQCGLVALKTRDIFMVKKEQIVQVNINLQKWVELGEKVQVILQVVEDKENLSEIIKGVITNYREKNDDDLEKVKKYKIISDDLKIKFTTKQNSEKSKPITTINFEPLQTEREVVQQRIEKLNTDRNEITVDKVTPEMLSLFADFIYHQQALTNIELLIDHYAEQLAHHLKDASNADCALEYISDVERVTILIKNKLHWPQMYIHRPCFTNDSWMSEYAIHAFPFKEEDNVRKYEVHFPFVWVTKGNIVYEGLLTLLQEYNENLESIYWIPTLPKTDIPTEIRALVTKTPMPSTCMTNEIPQQLSQVIPLGINNVLYYAGKSEILYFQCENEIITKQVTTGLQKIELDYDCKFMYPENAEEFSIDVMTDDIQYKFVPKTMVHKKEQETEQKDNIDKNGFLNLKFTTYLLYATYVFLTLSVTGCFIWNIRSLRCLFLCIQKHCTRRREQANSQTVANITPSAPIVTYMFQSV